MGLGDAIGGVLSSVLGKGPVAPPDLSGLFATISQAGEKEQDLIKALPPQLQQQYALYKASNAATGAQYQGDTAALAAGLEPQMEAVYDPNAPAVQAAEDSAKRAIYSNVPGQQMAIREALAASGGFDRGTASKQLAAPVLQAGQQYATQVGNITTQQLQAKQNATMKAIETVTAMNDDALKSVFGMNKDQALQILNGNRQDLKDQLSSLINQQVTQTNQTLGVQGAQVQNQFNYDAAKNAKDNADLNAWINLGTNLIAPGSVSGFLSGLGVGNNSSSAVPTYAPPPYASSFAGLPALS